MNSLSGRAYSKRGSHLDLPFQGIGTFVSSFSIFLFLGYHEVSDFALPQNFDCDFFFIVLSPETAVPSDHELKLLKL